MSVGLFLAVKTELAEAKLSVSVQKLAAGVDFINPFRLIQ
jgi:hypothetical protein